MKEKQFFPKAFAYTTRRIMPVNGFDSHEQRKAYRNHHMPACVTISGRHARNTDRRKFNPCNRHQDRNTHFLGDLS